VVPGAEANSMMSAGTLTSRNNVEMIQSISAMLHKLRLNNDAIIFISTFITNVPDKIIATATAVVLIFLFGTLPNYKTQKRIIRSNHDVVNSKFIDNRVLLFTVCSIPMLTSPVVTWKITHNITSVGIIAAICFFALTCSMIEHSYLRSLDREIRPDEDFTEDNKIFFSIPESYSLRFQREIFEDILKLAVIVVSGLSFIVASFAPNSAYCDSEHLDSLVGCGMLYRLAVINILILTGYRYVLVVIMRLIGRI
jgi:hypothetical protein